MAPSHSQWWRQPPLPSPPRAGGSATGGLILGLGVWLSECGHWELPCSTCGLWGLGGGRERRAHQPPPLPWAVGSGWCKDLPRPCTARLALSWAAQPHTAAVPAPRPHPRPVACLVSLRSQATCSGVGWRGPRFDLCLNKCHANVRSPDGANHCLGIWVGHSITQHGQNPASALLPPPARRQRGISVSRKL